MLVKELLEKLDYVDSKLDYAVISCNGSDERFELGAFKEENLNKMTGYLDKEVKAFSFWADHSDDAYGDIDDGMLPLIISTLWIDIE
jgi:hypothetical protein